MLVRLPDNEGKVPRLAPACLIRVGLGYVAYALCRKIDWLIDQHCHRHTLVRVDGQTSTR